MKLVQTLDLYHSDFNPSVAHSKQLSSPFQGAFLHSVVAVSWFRQKTADSPLFFFPARGVCCCSLYSGGSVASTSACVVLTKLFNSASNGLYRGCYLELKDRICCLKKKGCCSLFTHCIKDVTHSKTSCALLLMLLMMCCQCFCSVANGAWG